VSRYYRDIDQLYEIYGRLMDKVLSDEKTGPKLGKAGIVIKFIYTDPDGELTVDLKNPPAKPGYYGTWYLGPCDVKADVWSKQAADFSHSFWHGYENPIAAVTKGKVKQGGKITAMLKLLPTIRPIFAVFPDVLTELGYSDKIIPAKK
jgi:hypothetical protein